jgi:hypothetical protein
VVPLEASLDFNQRMLELSAEDFRIPEGKSSLFTLVEMTVFPGRSLAAKKNYIKKSLKILKPWVCRKMMF